MEDLLYVALTFLITMFLKDIGIEFAAGLGFYFDNKFKKGDVIFIDGEEAIIDRIGVRRTTFIMVETSRTRFVLNTRINLLTLEKF